MPHFTVVPVEDQSRAGYDALEGLSWVDYSQPGPDGAPRASCQRDPYDSVSSDGEWRRGSGWAGRGDTRRRRRIQGRKRMGRWIAGIINFPALMTQEEAGFTHCTKPGGVKLDFIEGRTRVVFDGG
uniref:Uncharacterized protein n=1 Tax=Laticauda laticaudata TaxID=8630 RepID=A0A8C5S6W2_LATLA